MPRRRIERGYVYKVGKVVKMWEGRYHVYVTLPDGTEKRRERTKILGSCAEMSKGDAEQALIRQIAISRGQAGPMPDNPTFRDLWTRYRTLKEPTWSTATRKAVVSLFEGAQAKKAAETPQMEAPKKVRRPPILSMIGHRRVVELTRDPLQECLNQMATRGDSFSAVKKARTYITAALEFALDEQLIMRNSGRKLEMPSKRLPKPCGRFYSLDEVRRLLSAAATESFRERLIVHLFVLCGLRAQELFVLRVDDFEPGILRIDEALKDAEKGAGRIGDTKSTSSNGYVALSPELEEELHTWLQIRNMGDPYHTTAAPEPNSLLFPSETGTPYRIGNYLKRVLKPVAVKAGIADMTYQALRRTFATHFQRYGSPKDAQAQLRHSKLEMTGWYMKQIPETVRAAVKRMDDDICNPEFPKSGSAGAVQ